MKSRRTKIFTLISVSALALAGVAFVSSASADETATPSPTESASSSGSSDESDAQAIVNGSQSASDISSETPEDTEAVEPEEIDTEVAEIDAENQAEGAAFSQDVAEAGDAEDAATLAQAGAEVTSVTAPEAADTAADNHQANALINDTPTPPTP